MSRTSRNLILLLAVVLGVVGRAHAADASITVSGIEMQPSGVWDTGSITISFSDSTGHTYSETVTYGRFSTPASIASAFGAKFSNDYLPAGLLCAHAVGSVIDFHLKGTAAFGLPSITNSSVSFALAVTGWSATPSITGISPASGAVGASVTITGTGFGAGSAVTFNGVQATAINILSSTTILAVVPTGATTGNVVVKVGTVASNGSPFTVLSAPVITSVSPQSGGTGTAVTITGTNFGATPGTVTLNGTLPTPITGWSNTSVIASIISWSNTSIVVAVPPGSAAGSVDIGGATESTVVVTVNGLASNGAQFMVSTPVITSLSPPQGSAGTRINISGWNFGTTQGAVTVTLNGQVSTITEFEGSNHYFEGIAVTVPSGATTGNLVVSVNGVPSNPLVFTVLQQPGLIVSSSAASATAGSSVTFTTTIYNGPSSGVITYYDDGVTAIGTAAINGTTATYTTSSLTPGNHSITATYAGNSSYNSARSVPLTEQISGQIALPGPGIINSIAGVGIEGYTGDTFAATSAELSEPFGITVDGDGNVYFADSGNCAIRKVTASTANIDMVVGRNIVDTNDYPYITPECGFGYQGGWYAEGSELYWPSGVMVNSSGNLYIADTYNNMVAMTTHTGNTNGSGWNLDPVAGSTQWLVSDNNVNSGYSGDGGLATNAYLYGPAGVAVDSSGNIYIADTDNNVIRKVTFSSGVGTITTVAGNGTQGYSGDNGSATSASLTWPIGIALDSSGNLYIADAGNNAIRKVTLSGTITTVAGNGTQGYSGDDSLATSAELSGPSGVALDTSGNLYIADTDNNVIRKVTLSTGIISTVAGNGTQGYSGDGGLASSAELSSPGGVAVDASGNIYISDTENQRIRVVGTSRTIPTIAWTQSPVINYGTVLTSGMAPLNATAGAITGTFAYTIASGTASGTSAAGTMPAVGTYTLSVTFTPTDTSHYAAATASVTLTVNQIPAPIVWNPPASTSVSTPLSATQYNATSVAAGTWTYLPALGTMLKAGPQLLTVTLTPTDTVDYLPSTATVSINVTTGATSDAGTVTLTVNTGTSSSPNFVTAASTTYTAGATPSTIASGLASGVAANSPVRITATDDDIYIQATVTGAATNYAYSLQTSSWNSAAFTSPSFVSPAITGTLDGGADAQSTGSPSIVYSYVVPASSGYDGDSNLLAFSDSVMGSWNFNYDTLNRLSTAAAAANAPAPYAGNYGCWSYDAFGNRISQSMSTTPCGNNPPLTSWASYGVNNRFTATSQATGGVSYDPAGNVLNDGVNQYLYDGAGRICAVASTPVPGMTSMTGYVYDAAGARVAKGSITAWSCDPVRSGFKTINDYVLGPNGEQVTEMGVNSAAGSSAASLVWQHSNVFAAGALLATYDADGLHFYLNDPLGSRRVQTDYAGVVEQTCSSLPFGDALRCTSSTTAPTEHHFTGKERDQESGNDYFGARYYNSAMGRFMSPDPSQLVFTSFTNPQALNLYAYVMNNPMIHIDPNGWDCVYFNNSGNKVESVDHNSNSGECGSNGGDWVNGYTQSNWAVYNGGNDTWNISSLDSADVYYTTAAAPGAQQPNGNAPCSGNCDLGYASIARGWLFGQMIAGNSMDFMQWISAAGVKNSGYNGSQYPLSILWKYLLSGPDGSNNYAGPGGGGQPHGPNDWAAAMHDYNYFKIGGIGQGYSFISNPGDSVLTTPMLRQADAILGAHVSGTEGAAINKAVSAGALWTKTLSLFH